MLTTMIRPTWSLSIYVLLSFGSISYAVDASFISTITLNGEETRVHFNDGDTFKILDGKQKLSRVRVHGINALETYGPVHQWLGSSSEYLLTMANAATKSAQRGQWTCVTDGEKDAYGRLLAQCNDLAHTLLKAGLAHAYSVDNTRGIDTYLEKQMESQELGLGMWKYGIPRYIITSLHTSAEGHKKTYNRLISTKDGSSKYWYHKDDYSTCQNVCLEGEDGSCMVYVPYEKRYGSNRPECLFSSPKLF